MKGLELQVRVEEFQVKVSGLKITRINAGYIKPTFPYDIIFGID